MGEGGSRRLTDEEFLCGGAPHPHCRVPQGHAVRYCGPPSPIGEGFLILVLLIPILFQLLAEDYVALVARGGYFAVCYGFEDGTALLLGVRAFCVAAFGQLLLKLGKGPDKLVLLHKVEVLEIKQTEAGGIRKVTAFALRKLHGKQSDGACGVAASARLCADRRGTKLKTGEQHIKAA